MCRFCGDRPPGNDVGVIVQGPVFLIMVTDKSKGATGFIVELKISDNYAPKPGKGGLVAQKSRTIHNINLRPNCI